MSTEKYRIRKYNGRWEMCTPGPGRGYLSYHRTWESAVRCFRFDLELELRIKFRKSQYVGRAAVK